MRILHILDHSVPLQSGYSFRTLAILRQQRARGWQTSQLTSAKQSGAAAEIEIVDGYRFHRVLMPVNVLDRLPGGRPARIMLYTGAQLYRLAKDWQPDVLHAHSPVLNALPALWIGRLLRLPVVYEVRAFWEDAAASHGAAKPGGLRYRLSRMIESFALRRVDGVTTICEGLKHDILGRGIADDQITIIANGVDPDTFDWNAPPDPELSRKLDLTGKTVIGFIGSFYSYEGLDLLIEAMATMADERPDLRLLLVGGGPENGALRELVHRRGLDESVVFAGRVGHDQVPHYYGLIDIFAYPRRSVRLTELVTPLKPLEAMAEGKLVMASDIGGHRELITDGETGVLFPADSPTAIADTLRHLLDHRETWPDIQAKARDYVHRKRNWSHCTEGYTQAYRRAADRRRGR